MRKFAIVLALTLLPAAAFAQENPPQGPPPGGMRGGPGRMGMQQNTVEWLLTQKDQFRPTAEQVAKLDSISTKLKKEIQEERDKLQKMREGMQNDPNADRSEMREHFRKSMEDIRKKDDEATEDAVKLLNDEQQKVVKDLIAAHKKEMEARRQQMRGGFGGN